MSVLRQLRDGFSDRPVGFPQSIGLIGLRSFTLRNFSVEELAELYSQHTEETG